MSSDHEIVTFENVRKTYANGRAALNGLNFEVKKGELLALLGPNGAGKSTSLNILLGLKSWDSGNVRVFGQSPKNVKVRARIGATPQDLAFPGLLSIRELLHFVQKHYLLSRPELKGKLLTVEQVAASLDLTDYLDRRAAGLSGGERRKLGLAMAICGSPDLLILDEPTTGMDVEGRRELWRVIERLLTEGRTVILTTHYLEEVEALAKRVVVVDKGIALFDGTVEQIKAKVEMKKVQFLSENKFDHSQLIGVIKCEAKGPQITLFTHNSDELVKQLVQRKAEFFNLTIEMASLEEAFLEIRGRL